MFIVIGSGPFDEGGHLMQLSRSCDHIDDVVEKARVQLNLIEKFTNPFTRLQKMIIESKAE